MGDYTRLHFSARLGQNTPQEIVAVLRYMIGEHVEDMPVPALPEHKLFKTEQWSSMLFSGSSYHADTLAKNGCPDPTLEAGEDGLRLTILSSFKEYDGEVDLFCDWISPYLLDEDGAEVGSTQFEFAAYPTKLVKDRGMIVRLAIERPEQAYDGYPIVGQSDGETSLQLGVRHRSR